MAKDQSRKVEATLWLISVNRHRATLPSAGYLGSISETVDDYQWHKLQLPDLPGVHLVLISGLFLHEFFDTIEECFNSLTSAKWYPASSHITSIL